jgi:predicted Zn-ribbon and HTH transcriptional regulator
MGTLREEIADLIRQQSRTAREISVLLGIQEKDVYQHLVHIARSAAKSGVFHVEPARCITCGYVFRERKKLTRPGRCPRCRSQRITRPSFSLGLFPS